MVRLRASQIAPALVVPNSIRRVVLTMTLEHKPYQAVLSGKAQDKLDVARILKSHQTVLARLSLQSGA